MAAANNSVKDLKTELKSFGGGSLAGTIGIAGVIAGFKATLQHAQDVRSELERMGKPIDDATRSVAAYSDAWDGIKKAVGSASVSVLSFATRAGEGLGAVVNMLRGYSVEQQRLNERIASDTEKTLASIAAAKKKYEEANSPEKVAAAEERLAAVQRKNAMEQMDAYGRLNALIAERAKLEQDSANVSNKAGVDYIEAKTRIAEKDAEIQKARAAAVEADRKQLADFTKDDAESQRKADEWTASLTQKTKDRTAAQKDLTDAVNKTAEAVADEGKIAEEAYKKWLAGMEEVAKTKRGIVGARTDTADLSDSALGEIIRRNRDAVDQLSRAMPDRFLGNPNASEIARLQAESGNAQRELDFRSGFRRNVEIGGESLARRQFSGDPGAFDQIFERLARNGALTEDDKTKGAITDIRDILQTTLKKK
jgi:hypothetical protein